MMDENGGVSDRGEGFQRRNRVNRGHFGHVEDEVIVEVQNMDLEVKWERHCEKKSFSGSQDNS